MRGTGTSCVVWMIIFSRDGTGQHRSGSDQHVNSFPVFWRGSYTRKRKFIVLFSRIIPAIRPPSAQMLRTIPTHTFTKHRYTAVHEGSHGRLHLPRIACFGCTAFAQEPVGSARGTHKRSPQSTRPSATHTLKPNNSQLQQARRYDSNKGATKITVNNSRRDRYHAEKGAINDRRQIAHRTSNATINARRRSTRLASQQKR